jgi:hypothetical protein
MHKRNLAIVFLLVTALPAFAGHKTEGRTTLKDMQPTGGTDKEHKHTAYDLTFGAEGKNYTCRTDYHKSINATDFVVGTEMTYKIDDQKVKIKSAQNKELECKIVRVEAAPTP